VLKCVAVCCSVLQCVAVCCSVLHRVALCCSALQCVAVSNFCAKGFSLLQCVAACVALCCSVLLHVLFQYQSKDASQFSSKEMSPKNKMCLNESCRVCDESVISHI